MMAAPSAMPPGSEQALRERIAQLERDLAAARRRLRHLEDLDRIYTDFALAVSHELRTPLTLISGYAQQLLLRWTTTDEERRHSMVERINVSSRRLGRLLDDILLMAQVESGDLSVQMRVVAAAEIMGPVLDEISDRYPTHRPAISVTGTEASVYADRFRLEQVLICLLDNAVKHTPAHETIAVHWSYQGDETVAAVTDCGGGISPDAVPRLFRRFGRLQRTISQSHGGVGIGLYIAGQLAEAMGGRISVQSTPGAGTTFLVALAKNQATAHQ